LLDHPSAPRGGGAVLREAAQGGRGRAEEAHPVDALRHGADLGDPVLGLRRVPDEPRALPGPADRPQPRVRVPVLHRGDQTTGTIFVMWLGEKITEHGIGNGISLIIFVNIIGRMPNTVRSGIESVHAGTVSLFVMLFVVAMMVLVIAAVILMTQATRKIRVQYAK